MKNKSVSGITKLKLALGTGCLFAGIILTFVAPMQGLVLILAANLLHLDGRISRLEEFYESDRKQAD